MTKIECAVVGIVVIIISVYLYYAFVVLKSPT